MNPQQPLSPQMLILVATYMGLAVIGRLVYAFSAQGARGLLSSDKARLWIRWIAGGVMIAAAVWSVFALQHVLMDRDSTIRSQDPRR